MRMSGGSGAFDVGAFATGASTCFGTSTVGGAAGGAGRAYLSDGTGLKGKGKQIVPPGLSLIMELPGGGGLGDTEEGT